MKFQCIITRDECIDIGYAATHWLALCTQSQDGATVCTQTLALELAGVAGARKSAHMPSIEPMFGRKFESKHKQQYLCLTHQ